MQDGKSALDLAIEYANALQDTGRFSDYEVRVHFVPAAVIGYYPEETLAEDSSELRSLVIRIAASCTGLWASRIASHFGADPDRLRAIWRLSDEDREAEILRSIRREADRVAARAKLKEVLSVDYLSADRYYRASLAELMEEADFLATKHGFVRSWLADHLGLDAETFPDEEQVAAIAAANGAVQVVARAGSGKTRTIVLRTVFLMKHCRVPPESLLLLAFNRAAAFNMRRELLFTLCKEAKQTFDREESGQRDWGSRSDRRLRALESTLRFHEVLLPTVLTFHALAYGLVSPEQSLLMDNRDTGDLSFSRAVQDVIDDHLRDPKWHQRIRSIMLLHFRSDWDAISRGGFDRSPEDLIEHRRLLPRESLAGERVKSHGEKLIADVLFEHGVTYKYERNHRWDGFNYRPDFTVFRTTGREPTGIVIEYFGLQGDADYDEVSDRKREYWLRKSGWEFLEYNPRDLDQGTEAFRARVVRDLGRLGIKCVPLSDADIWERVKQRAIDRFTQAMSNFIGRCRKGLVSAVQLRERISAHDALSEAEHQFIRLGARFYDRYLASLAAGDFEDFDGVLQRAIQALKQGDTLVRRGQSVTCDIRSIRYVCVDEFQDFSELFYQLVSAIRAHAKEDHCFCVGDDWQAINSFAGSDLRFFQEFSEYMGDSQRLSMSTNYRSAASIVRAGNEVMAGLGSPARYRPAAPKGSVQIACMNTFESTLPEQRHYPGDDITPAMLRLAHQAISRGRRVVLLSRTNRVPWYVNWSANELYSPGGLDGFASHLRAALPEVARDMLDVSTTHKYKGLERDTVIVLDAVRKSYPLIHADWVFGRVLGASLEHLVDEERRLFYVAVTRARSELILVTEEGSETPFMAKLASQLERMEWPSYSPSMKLAEHMVVRVLSRPGVRLVGESGNLDAPTYVIRESLRLAGFTFRSSSSTKCWERLAPTGSFDLKSLLAESWAAEGEGIEVALIDGSGAVRERWAVDRGQAVALKPFGET